MKRLGRNVGRLVLLVVGFGLATPALRAQGSLAINDARAANSGPSSVVVGGTVNATLTATATGAPTAVSGCTLNPPSWSWSYLVQYASSQGGSYGAPPAGAGYTVTLGVSSSTNPTSASLSATFNQTGWWKVTPTATVTYTDSCGGRWTASGTAAPTNVLTVAVVGVQKIQFQLPGKGFQDIPLDGLYVAVGTTVAFQAIPSPTDASWPSGTPVWGGTCGASGTGPTTTVILSTPSASMSDTQTITAGCSNTISAPIVRYGPDQSSLDMNWSDGTQTQVLFNVSFQLWVPDADLDGQPDTPGGEAILNSIDFNNMALYLNLTSDPSLIQQASWTFNNGQSMTGLTAPAFAPTIYPSWVLDGSSSMSKAPKNPPRQGSLYDALERERADDVDVLCQQPPPDPLRVIANLIKHVDPKAVITDALLKELKDTLNQSPIPISPNDGTATNGRGEISSGLTSAGQDVQSTLTVTAHAFQAQPLAKFVLKILLQADAKAHVSLGQITGADKTIYYSTPFVAIADRYPDIAGKAGPIFPVMESTGPVWKQDAQLPNQGPTTDIRAERPAIVRLGYVYGAANYATTDIPNVIFDHSAVTNTIDPKNATPIWFSNPLPASIAAVIDGPWTQAQAFEWAARGYVMQQGRLDNTVWTRIYQTPNRQPMPPYHADFLSMKLTISWK